MRLARGSKEGLGQQQHTRLTLPITGYTSMVLFHGEHLSGTEPEHCKFNWSEEQHISRVEVMLQLLKFAPVGFNATQNKTTGPRVFFDTHAGTSQNAPEVFRVPTSVLSHRHKNLRLEG